MVVLVRLVGLPGVCNDILKQVVACQPALWGWDALFGGCADWAGASASVGLPKFEVVG